MGILRGKPLAEPVHARDLNDAELDHLRKKKNCPYCGGRLYDGPTAGLSVNFICDGCGARLNLAIIPGHGIWKGEYMGNENA